MRYRTFKQPKLLCEGVFYFLWIKNASILITTFCHFQTHPFTLSKVVFNYDFHTLLVVQPIINRSENFIIIMGVVFRSASHSRNTEITGCLLVSSLVETYDAITTIHKIFIGQKIIFLSKISRIFWSLYGLAMDNLYQYEYQYEYRNLFTL